MYLVGFVAKTNRPDSSNLLVNFYTEDGVIDDCSWTQGKFETYLYDFEKPITEIRIYAAATEDAAIGYRVQLESIYVEPVEPDFD